MEFCKSRDISSCHVTSAYDRARAHAHTAGRLAYAMCSIGGYAR